MPSRFSLALESGAVTLPERGDVLVMRPGGDFDFGGIAVARVRAVQGFFPECARLRARGVDVDPSEINGAPVAAVICVPKAKAEALDVISRACAALPDGAPVILDGDKAQGIESILKLCRKVAAVGPAFSKAHGKTFSFPNPGALPPAWRAMPQSVAGYETRAGVFSADGVDPGSAALVAALPALKGRVCDLGAGWGYLAGEALTRNPAITALDLVEAEWAALACAKASIADPRAAFHWADARAWTGRYDAVLSNPPFHIGRETLPALGQAFIMRAAQLLAPKGQFLMVANRHLPYESTLRTSFSEVVVLSETAGYKVISARRPTKG